MEQMLSLTFRKRTHTFSTPVFLHLECKNLIKLRQRSKILFPFCLNDIITKDRSDPDPNPKLNLCNHSFKSSSQNVENFTVQNHISSNKSEQ